MSNMMNSKHGTHIGAKSHLWLVKEAMTGPCPSSSPSSSSSCLFVESSVISSGSPFSPAAYSRPAGNSTSNECRLIDVGIVVCRGLGRHGNKDRVYWRDGGRPAGGRAGTRDEGDIWPCLRVTADLGILSSLESTAKYGAIDSGR